MRLVLFVVAANAWLVLWVCAAPCSKALRNRLAKRLDLSDDFERTSPPMVRYDPDNPMEFGRAAAVNTLNQADGGSVK